MTADRPDPMELLGELEVMGHGIACHRGPIGSIVYSDKCICWKSKLPALRAAIEAMQGERSSYPRCVECGEWCDYCARGKNRDESTPTEKGG